ncbi:hypothetical protein KXQ82_10395 [Mucilaginibacter sp. HMF5004]|uniref:hypothetical protein n=1 Tax=Mucilaginibacter rivuli TaxID=2857527 RepID=UPI001C6037B9|nr:hypothetical protein [Mucilaginibacter rivuli]MBW4890128.1 hypothetical protein [Mucilaginibacter rivuli]
MKNIYWFIVFIGVLAVSACSDLIEKSISGSQVILQTPGNNYQSSSYTLNFWWDKVDNALDYHLQIVTPKFDSVANLVLDTVVKRNTYTFTLPPGKYQWRVRAENGSSATPYSTVYSFTVLYSSIKQQITQLVSPSNNTFTNQNPYTFQWQSMYGATKYRLQVDTNNFVNEANVIYNQVIPGLQANYAFPKDQTYQWRVRAENDTAQAKWSTVNIITYNHTPPGIVTLVAPSNRQTTALPVVLQWNAVAKATKYKLYVLKSDSTTLYNSSFPAPVTSTTYNFNLGKSGDHFYWKVSAVDAAGNEGTASVMRNFFVQ